MEVLPRSGAQAAANGLVRQAESYRLASGYDPALQFEEFLARRR
jgi:hypothetical protein